MQLTASSRYAFFLRLQLVKQRPALLSLRFYAFLFRGDILLNILQLVFTIVGVAGKRHNAQCTTDQKGCSGKDFSHQSEINGFTQTFFRLSTLDDRQFRYPWHYRNTNQPPDAQTKNPGLYRSNWYVFLRLSSHKAIKSDVNGVSFARMLLIDFR